MGSQYLVQELEKQPIERVRATARKLGLGRDESSCKQIVHALAEVRDLHDWAYKERRLCEELGIVSQEERRTQAAVDASTAAKRSASASVACAIIAAVSTLVAVLSLLLSYATTK